MNDVLILFIIPLMAALVAYCIPLRSARALKCLSICLAFLPLLWLSLNVHQWVGAAVDTVWLPGIGIHFYLRVDALSLLFLFLTALIIPISLMLAPREKVKDPHLFYALVLLLQAMLAGFFCARDLALFTIFWEAMLIPLYFIITIWGGAERQQAAFKFLIYMIAGSALMLMAVFALYISPDGEGTFNMDILSKRIGSSSAMWIFPLFLLAFAVKTPLFPFHAWLPDTYCQAPPSGTILLAGLLSKAGIYGILRVGFELFPSDVRAWSPLLLSLAIAGVLYGGLVAWRQQNFKRLIAYSSFAHVNFILAGLFIWNEMAHAGAILQALNHGITITALFLTTSWLEERLGTTAFGMSSGLAYYFPKLCWLTLFCVLSSIALPGLNNFVGEFMILFGLLAIYPWLTPLLGVTVILSALYMLRWMQTMYFNAPCMQSTAWSDISRKEIAIAMPLLLLMLWMGIYPRPFLEQIWPIAEKFMNPS